MSIILETRSISKSFGVGAAKVSAVDQISLQIRMGEILLIMGPSGSGKTTFLSMLGGLLSADEGEVLIDGVDITQLKPSQLPDIRAKTIGFIFQSFNLLDALTVEENILFPASLLDEKTDSVRQRCGELIRKLGLQDRRKALPQTLSGGEKQRVAIARALINQPKVILADEPTGNLDSQSGQEVMMLLHDVARDQGVAVLIVTHDPRVEDIADRILWLEDGKIIDRKAESHQWIKDPVCGMRVDEWRALHFVDYQKSRYAFCSRRCRERFVENPEKYVE
ncbi:ATP-binding cassette domain-containing protein [Ketobacter alkanivorans]|jgi:putative ABC transport system ATP-binding protein|uniref:ABC transporter domain-containing protein n=1 Tax=Ketobacter alkanivorans TaxID=1917421 RepID=A0A2K9LFQ0_9GAMM|nr:ATP-binding cassette domain-containing protein [Ketobacter alkanivorans]MAR91836.1 hypothetical protein [Pseudomonadales bacterium]HAG95940.1 YHS domain-containing protein [Gammaproteobacteria bacterium]AUM11102.1 hypothetical protein Kalk_01035 [Ketobacter alkanivorans]MAR93422.1 hypothetical protein [Pseudomonadales bacterium]HAU14395.1 YHS domain-containing protein [Gammaproteobacteria bacterium]|tara:strand:+ start:656 stop:1492 length:837 start_codon:yes stop_codon:yes gene_type:complete